MNDLSLTGDALVSTDHRFMIHPLHHPQDHAAPKIFVSAKGAMLRTADGKDFIDGLSALWNVNIGHGRKELAAAAAKQMETLDYASAYAGYTNEPAVRLAERIVGLAYSNSAAVYFTTSGAESNESAFKFARYHWKRLGKPGKVKIISRRYGYHGVTMGAMSATSLPNYHKMFGPMIPEFKQVAPPYPYRWPGNGDAGIGAADAVEALIQAEGPDTIAAIIAEPVMGSGGVIVPPATYFPRLRQICDRHDVLLIADEVITGFGRTGQWFGMGHWGVEPDLFSFAKGVTSGYLPLGGVVISRKLHDVIQSAPADEKFMHAATYSGHPVCCAVGLANIDIMDKEGLVERARVEGDRFRAGLETLASLSCVGEVRGIGMLAALELVEDKGSKKPAKGLGAKVVAQAAERGLILRVRAAADGPPASGDVLCLAPPLSTPAATLDRIVQIVGESIQAVL
ncbi:aspartate aminotransferase family protein [Rhodopila sp.]|jgi:adenosylmethionine-8-amino-7-oxononanoate aminotransferase|uniref:aminotransferase family protein n=1 Tax=Rhodopila sp. TaxID=2480087 RepID=UPI002CC2F3BD|nr:aspartate aminotransferase family protein [Rhodopila sp.]HVZ10744.1 aspartate aminotransferase family protein [Rhodopila sp.]